MTTSATPSGVPATDAAQTNDQLEANLNTGSDQREPTPRELMMDQIAANNTELMVKEIIEQGGTDPRVKPGDKPAATGADDDSQLDAQLGTPTVLDSGLDKVMVRIKIDGVEREVSVEEMQREYQKNGAADKRLAEATRLLKEAKETTKTAVIPPVGIEGNSKATDIPAADEAKPGDDGKNFLTALFEGDQDKAFEALQKLGIGRPQGSTTIDLAQLTAQITPQIKQRLIDESALEKFGKDYADIVGDSYLADVSDKFLEEEMEGGMPFAEALGVAGQRTRDWLKDKGVAAPAPAPVPAPEEKPTTVRDQKLERKAGMDVLPALNSKATVVEEPAQTTSDVIAEMRKARGLDG